MRPSLASLGQTTAVSVATILGTGILGLPVSLHHSGLGPFFVLFTLCFITQSALVVLVAEILQRAYVTPDAYGENAALSKQESSPLEDACDYVDTTEHKPPSLYMLTALFIPSRALRTLSNIMFFAHFILVAATYAIAGPQAYYAFIPALRSVPVSVSTGLFVVIVCVLVFFFTELVIPPLSVGTLLKGIILTILVIVTFISGLSFRHSSVSRWDLKGMIDPYLIGVFSLSGIPHLMPVTFQTCLESLPTSRGPRHNHVDREFISAYRAACVLAIFICYVLNVAWSIAVLYIVPQDATSVSTGQAVVGSIPNATLTIANERGLISTIPLIEVLQATQNQLNWIVAFLVNLFIAVSITISLFVMFVGLLHFMEGASDPMQSSVASTEASENEASMQSPFSRTVLPRYFLASFTVLIISVFNPSAIFKIMEGGLSVALNMENGVFFPYMFFISRRVNVQAPSLPTLSPMAALIALLLTVTYYSTAILVDVIFYLPYHLY